MAHKDVMAWALEKVAKAVGAVQQDGKYMVQDPSTGNLVEWNPEQSSHDVLQLLLKFKLNLEWSHPVENDVVPDEYILVKDSRNSEKMGNGFSGKPEELNQAIILTVASLVP